MDGKRRVRKSRVRLDIFTRDQFKCQLCGWQPHVPDGWDGTERLTDKTGRFLTIDHIVEAALGGPSTRDNFRAACNRCNVRRSVHVGKLIKEGQDMGLTLEEARERARTILGLT